LPCHIKLSREALRHLRALTANQRALVADAIRRQSPYQPSTETRNRKPLRTNPLADWELRVPDLRVYYVIREGDEPRVEIRAIGVKVRDRVYLGGEEADLP
jgi:mRNA-degrading endonuclease RelE of RelBE toxin-antitoxin system